MLGMISARRKLEILGVDSAVSESFCYHSTGTLERAYNYAKVYSGLYECSGQRIPFVLVIKVGSGDEVFKPGNRGKRDSQLLLLYFLSNVNQRLPLSPLEVELYHHFNDIIGVHPGFYEYVMMVDADTEVAPDSLARMVEVCLDGRSVVGVCGESRLSNEKASWVTMIQVYEYFVSHNLSKAFESLFGNVTCLPGCFCLIRLKTGSKPILLKPDILRAYGKRDIVTLHEQNLLTLGEDRYLTTLLLKHFPGMSLSFCNQAMCKTKVPDTWPALLSQRRRWINSAIHNLAELLLLPNLCGFCCFSMRFMVSFDLFGSLVMPASVIYLAYLLYQSMASQHSASIISLMLMCLVYSMQSIIFLGRREWEYAGWMIIHILALPITGFVIPVYACWHFDDFTWDGMDSEAESLDCKVVKAVGRITLTHYREYVLNCRYNV